MDIQTCPRRMREMGPWSREEGQDSWLDEPRRTGGAVPVCSFCGSLHPGKFLELVAEGWLVGPTDKSYKAYLHQTSRDPEGPVRAKFYFQHLSDEQQQQFVNLYNAGMVHFSAPGHFYVLPFFMRIATPDPGSNGGGC